MRVPHLRLAALALLSGVTLGGCAYGLGDPYGGGYGGVNVGYGNGYYGGGYGSPYGYGGGYGGYGYGSPYGYAGYGGGYGSPYGYGYDPYGWYGNYYYPGSGNYVYDRDRRRHVMTDEQRRHWRALFARFGNNRTGGTTATTQSVAPRENWSGFNRQRVRTSANTDTNQRSNRGRWQGRTTAADSSGETTTTTTRDRSSNNGRRGRNRSNDD